MPCLISSAHPGFIFPAAAQGSPRQKQKRRNRTENNINNFLCVINKNKTSSMRGSAYRLQRLFGADGRCFGSCANATTDVAVDHGIFGELTFLKGIEVLYLLPVSTSANLWALCS
jgi:hypothetical protein